MSISSKRTFLFEAEKRMNEFLPVDSVNAVMKILSDQMANYEIERSTDCGNR